jgi:hypothetical protein
VNARRITEITIEATESVTIRRTAGSVRIACSECDPAGEMVTLEQACALLRVGVRAICREIEIGNLHFQETESGSIFICLRSLQNAAQQISGGPNPPPIQTKEISS